MEFKPQQAARLKAEFSLIPYVQDLQGLLEVEARCVSVSVVFVRRLMEVDTQIWFTASGSWKGRNQLMFIAIARGLLAGGAELVFVLLSSEV